MRTCDVSVLCATTEAAGLDSNMRANARARVYPSDPENTPKNPTPFTAHSGLHNVCVCVCVVLYMRNRSLQTGKMANMLPTLLARILCERNVPHGHLCVYVHIIRGVRVRSVRMRAWQKVWC